MNENLYTVHMGKAKCAVDLGDGSERGEYGRRFGVPEPGLQ